VGAIRAAVLFFGGMFELGACFIYSQPIFDFLFAIGNAMGGNAANIAQNQATTLIIMPYVFGFILIIGSIFEALRREDTTAYRRW
jgi:hypothetical protein